jgi:NAD(P)-dependent dehydrogenase (short-subunit alcohol dehydrogenase family)
VAAAFSFSRGAILAFKDNKELEEPTGTRGTLIFTGATAATRGNVVTSAFAAGKFGVRALSQSLAKEFGKENIHVAHVSLSPFSNYPFSNDESLIVHYRWRFVIISF